MAAPQARHLVGWIAIAALWAASFAAGQDAVALDQQLVQLYRDNAAAVVRVKIATQELDENGKLHTALLVLSGFFITHEGRVLTNAGENNATARATRIWIEKDGLSFLAELIGSDARSNIALLQAVKLPEKFGVIAVPETDDLPPAGSIILAITSPLDFDPSPATGLITGFESYFSENVFPFTYLRVNIPGGPGEGGSPVLNLGGQLVGVEVASVPQVRSSYVVPARALRRLIDDFATAGRVTYGTLPVEFAEYPDSLNVSRQVVISEVVPESSAARAGLRVGDIVRRLGVSPVRRIHDVRDAVFFARVGQHLVMEVEREGRRMEFALLVEAKPDSSPAATANPASSPAASAVGAPPAPVIAAPGNS